MGRRFAMAVLLCVLTGCGVLQIRPTDNAVVVAAKVPPRVLSAVFTVWFTERVYACMRDSGLSYPECEYRVLERSRRR